MQNLENDHDHMQGKTGRSVPYSKRA